MVLTSRCLIESFLLLIIAEGQRRPSAYAGIDVHDVFRLDCRKTAISKTLNGLPPHPTSFDFSIVVSTFPPKFHTVGPGSDWDTLPDKKKFSNDELFHKPIIAETSTPITTSTIKSAMQSLNVEKLEIWTRSL